MLPPLEPLPLVPQRPSNSVAPLCPERLKDATSETARCGTDTALQDLVRQLRLRIAQLEDELKRAHADQFRARQVVERVQEIQNVGWLQRRRAHVSAMALQLRVPTTSEAADRLGIRVTDSSPSSPWDESIPRVPGVARQLPPGWNTDWTVNTYAPLRPRSETSEVSERADPESVAAAGGNGAVQVAEIAQIASSESDTYDLRAREPMVPEAAASTSTIFSMPPPPTDHPSWYIDLVAPGAGGVNSLIIRDEYSDEDKSVDDDASLTYLQLTEEHESSGAFYLSALQKLKEERVERARRRKQCESVELVQSSLTDPSCAPVTPQKLSAPRSAGSIRAENGVDRLRNRATNFELRYRSPLKVD